MVESTQNDVKYRLEIKFISNSLHVKSYSNANYVDNSGASGDPHFLQYVKDQLTSKQKVICYDVTGQTEQSIKILTINNGKYQILGKLLDDYYMHSIEILAHRQKLMNVTKNSIFHKKNLITHWVNDQKRNLKIGDFDILIDRNLVILKNLNLAKFKMEIQRKQNLMRKTFSDASFALELKRKQDLGGLIGDVGKNHYKFLQSVQANGKNLVLVNGFLKTSTLKERGHKKCMLFNINDLLSANSYDKYVF